MTAKKYTLRGPNSLRLELDHGDKHTPAMVYGKDENGRELSATYWCARDTGELDCGWTMPNAWVRWLQQQAQEDAAHAAEDEARPEGWDS